MKLSKLITLGFDKNVGTMDRVARATGGTAFVVATWWWHLPAWAAVPGLMAVLTAASSKCSVYYLLGYSTCPMVTTREPS